MGTIVMEDVQRPELGPLPPPSIALLGHGTLHNTGLLTSGVYLMKITGCRIVILPNEHAREKSSRALTMSD